ncbi:hypothetical protein H7X87_01480 [Acetobacteraceae bacterium]|nr:hypothetical protein [Candidatus Parcubacteria bacterium]
MTNAIIVAGEVEVESGDYLLSIQRHHDRTEIYRRPIDALPDQEPESIEPSQLPDEFRKQYAHLL